MMLKRYGAAAALEAAQRADQLLADGNPEGCSTWRRILDAIERLQAMAPADGEIAAYGLVKSGAHKSRTRC